MARKVKAQDNQPYSLLEMIEQAEQAEQTQANREYPAPQSVEQQRQKLHEHTADSVPWEDSGATACSEQANSQSLSHDLDPNQVTHTASLDQIIKGNACAGVHAPDANQEQNLRHTQLGGMQELSAQDKDGVQDLDQASHGLEVSSSTTGQKVKSLVTNPIVSNPVVPNQGFNGQANTSAPSGSVMTQSTSSVGVQKTAVASNQKTASASTKRKSSKPKFVLEPFQYPLDPVQYVVCGIDEAGRGPLMGDVVAACVILDHNKMIPGIDDSKHLSEKKRDALAPVIKQYALAYGIGRASPAEIDELNILQATFLAMRRAYEMMQVTCNLALIDGNKIPPGLNIACQAVVKGDARVKEIGAASILAKTARDADLYELDKQYPEYKFAQHKGYPTAAHLEVLANLPILPCYRFSYGPVKKLITERNLQILPNHTLVERTS